jgi:hypothetical protein
MARNAVLRLENSYPLKGDELFPHSLVCISANLPLTF